MVEQMAQGAKVDANFYKGKNVLITGHTGFKGTWLSSVLLDMGANVIGYALEPPTNPSLFELCHMEKKLDSVTGDIRDLDSLKKLFREKKVDIAIHMAAQPLVRMSYQNPVYTYSVNVMGTVNILECVRTSRSVRSFLNITTDKVYKNREWEWGYRENEELNGFDPYSNSKSCSELVTESYKLSFFKDCDTAISTARAGNVIGGGDFAKDRIIPDCIRAVQADEEIAVRNPRSIRPYQHVLDPIMAYLLIAEAQYRNRELAGNYNIGPSEADCWETGRIVGTFCDKWVNLAGKKVEWKYQPGSGPHEANYLKLDCSKMKSVFGWQPKWNMEIALEKTVEWLDIYLSGGDVSACMERQIREFAL